MAPISASEKAIRDLGVKVINLKTTIDPAVSAVNAINVQAGDFPVADELEKTVTQRKDETARLLTAVGKELEDTGKKLTDNADNYVNTEKDNTSIADWKT